MKKFIKAARKARIKYSPSKVIRIAYIKMYLTT